MHKATGSHRIKEELKMMSFAKLFSDSAGELKKISTLTVSGMLIAMAVVLRNLSINFSQDLRINFAFLGTMLIAMLFGPVVSMMGAAGIDIIGYILDGYKARDYNVALLAVKLFAAVIYGVMLYKKTTGKSIAINSVVSRIISVLLCQLVLNSCVLYYSYTNRNFPFMSGSEWNAFAVWMTPRVIKNAVMLPVECALTAFILPVAYQAYVRVFKRSRASA